MLVIGCHLNQEKKVLSHDLENLSQKEKAKIAVNSEMFEATTAIVLAETVVGIRH